MPARVNTGPGPTELPARNQGGIAPPAPSIPRGPNPPSVQARAKPRTIAPIVPPAAIPRSRQDEIQRPITSPSTTRPVSATRPVMPPPPPGMAGGAALAPAAPLPAKPGQAAPAAPPAAPMMGGQPGEGGANLQMQDATAQAQGVAPVSPMDRAAQAQAMEDQRQAQPSHIPGIPMGTYEKVAKIVPPAGTSQIKTQKWNENRDRQLSEFGDWPGKGDPKAPAPPIRPYGRSFNPFTGKFTGETGPNAFSMMGIDFESLKSQYYKTGGGLK